MNIHPGSPTGGDSNVDRTIPSGQERPRKPSAEEQNQKLTELLPPRAQKSREQSGKGPHPTFQGRQFKIIGPIVTDEPKVGTGKTGETSLSRPQQRLPLRPGKRADPPPKSLTTGVGDTPFPCPESAIGEVNWGQPEYPKANEIAYTVSLKSGHTGEDNSAKDTDYDQEFADRMAELDREANTLIQEIRLNQKTPFPQIQQKSKAHKLEETKQPERKNRPYRQIRLPLNLNVRTYDVSKNRDIEHKPTFAPGLKPSGPDPDTSKGSLKDEREKPSAQHTGQRRGSRFVPPMGHTKVQTKPGPDRNTSKGLLEDEPKKSQPEQPVPTTMSSFEPPKDRTGQPKGWHDQADPTATFKRPISKFKTQRF